MVGGDREGVGKGEGVVRNSGWSRGREDNVRLFSLLLYPLSR